MHVAQRGYYLKKLWVFLVLICISIILVHSVIPESKSAFESLWVTDHIINPVFNLFGRAINDELVRKIAHIVEFFLLTLFLCILLRKYIRVFYAGFTIAFLDESLQILTRRGALVSDVWIDLIGVAFGVIICFVYNKLKCKKNINNRCQSK